jgi:hypothetical protein
MRKADEYRRRAHEADRQAKAALSNSARTEFEKIASNWRNLARQAEDLDRSDREGSSGERDPD